MKVKASATRRNKKFFLVTYEITISPKKLLSATYFKNIKDLLLRDFGETPVNFNLFAHYKTLNDEKGEYRPFLDGFWVAEDTEQIIPMQQFKREEFVKSMLLQTNQIEAKISRRLPYYTNQKWHKWENVQLEAVTLKIDIVVQHNHYVLANRKLFSGEIKSFSI